MCIVSVFAICVMIKRNGCLWIERGSCLKEEEMVPVVIVIWMLAKLQRCSMKSLREMEFLAFMSTEGDYTKGANV